MAKLNGSDAILLLGRIDERTALLLDRSQAHDEELGKQGKRIDALEQTRPRRLLTRVRLRMIYSAVALAVAAMGRLDWAAAFELISKLTH